MFCNDARAKGTICDEMADTIVRVCVCVCAGNTSILSGKDTECEPFFRWLHGSLRLWQ
jgi:hypothetical protein